LPENAPALSGPKLSLLKLHPNPARDQVTISLESREEVPATTIHVYDSYGQLVHTQPASFTSGTNFININITNLPEGVYMVMLPDGSRHKATARFVKIE